METKPAQIKWLDSVSTLLDSRFRIPLINVRFGLDSLIGLVPVAGDIVGFLLSSVLVIAMARHGAGGMVIMRMVGNIALDLFVGGVPILGDAFDLLYRSNRRNFELFRAHHNEGKYQGSAWPVILVLVLVLLGLLFLSFYVLTRIAAFALEHLFPF